MLSVNLRFRTTPPKVQSPGPPVKYRSHGRGVGAQASSRPVLRKKKKEEQIDRASAVLFIISLYRVVEVEEE